MKTIASLLICTSISLGVELIKNEAQVQTPADFWQKESIERAYFADTPTEEPSQAWLAKAWLEEKPVTFSRG